MEDTPCDRDLSRRSLSVNNTSHGLSWRVRVKMPKKNKIARGKQHQAACNIHRSDTRFKENTSVIIERPVYHVACKK